MTTIDVSTHQLAEQTCNALGGKTKLEDVLTVWHSIGGVVKTQISQKKGVKLTSLGTITITSAGDPVFIMSSELSNQFKLKQRAQPAPDNIPTTNLNFAQVASVTSVPRDQVEKMYTKFITVMGRSLFEGRTVLVTIHRVAELTIGKGELSYVFTNDFLKLFEGKNVKPPNQRDVYRDAAQKTGTIIKEDIRLEQRRQELSRPQNDFNIGAEEPPLRRGKLRASSAARERNPITGEREDGMSPSVNAGSGARRPASAGRARPGGAAAANRGADPRRPSSAHSHRSESYSVSTASLLHSPRSQSSNAFPNHGFNRTAPAAARGGGSASGLRKEQLERHARTQPQDFPAAGRRPGTPVNARTIAAKALDAGDIVAKVRAKIVERGGSNGIRSIGKLLTIMDDNGDHRLSKEELRYGLRDYGIDLTPTELEQVFLYFDRDGNGFIDATEFLVGLRGDLPEKRRRLVRMAFDILDKDGSGVITAEEILAMYDMNWHPEVRAGKKTIKEAAKEFMGTWDRRDKDGQVTIEEFEDYYKEISASIDSDDYFELMIRNAWRIAGGEGAAANTANRRVLVTNKDGSQSVQTIQKELGMKGGDMADVRARLQQQGVHAENIEMYGGMDTRDKPNKSQPQAPPQRSRQAPKEAWGGPAAPGPGDECLPGEYGNNSRGSANNGRSASAPRSGGREQPVAQSGSGGFDVFETLHRLLYSPPVNIEHLCIKLQVSSVTSAPRVAMGAFTTRLQTLDRNLSRDQLRQLWKAVDPNNTGSAEVTAIHGLLSDRFGKDKSAAKGTGIIERVIKKILDRCGENAGIKGLARTLAIMDNSGDKKLSKEELKYGLQDYGIELNIRELDEIFTYFDRDRSGTVDVSEFLIGIKGDMNDRRRKIIKLAFDILDKDRSGIITVDEMMDVYNVNANPEVQSGKKTAKEAMREFIKQWDRSADGEVTLEEFEDYYKEVSASIDGDDYFELMIRNAWRIAGGEGAAANTANRRVLVTNKDGSQSVQTIRNELGMKGGDMADVRARLQQQGVHAENIEMYGGMDTRDKPNKAQPPRGQDRGRGGGSGGVGGGTQRPADRRAPDQRPSLNRTAPAASTAVTRENTAFHRHAAAAKLAAAFRGRMGRKVAESERRKADAHQREQYEQEQEDNRPKPKQISRPKGKSYIGF